MAIFENSSLALDSSVSFFVAANDCVCLLDQGPLPTSSSARRGGGTMSGADLSRQAAKGFGGARRAVQ